MVRTILLLCAFTTYCAAQQIPFSECTIESPALPGFQPDDYTCGALTPVGPSTVTTSAAPWGVTLSGPGPAIVQFALKAPSSGFIGIYFTINAPAVQAIPSTTFPGGLFNLDPASSPQLLAYLPVSGLFYPPFSQIGFGTYFSPDFSGLPVGVTVTLQAVVCDNFYLAILGVPYRFTAATNVTME